MQEISRKKCLIIRAIIAAGFLFLPFSVTAQETITVYFDLKEQTIYEGDTFLATLKIDTPNTSINVVDGIILFDKSKLTIEEVITGNSLFAFWPEPPSISNDKGELLFVGGASSGFLGNGGNILQIVFLAKSEGRSTVDLLEGLSVFLNDGQGTQISPKLEPLLIDISERPVGTPIRDEWKFVLEKDKTPPDFVEVLISKNKHLFDNQYFVSFLATDKESGISHYEVKEGTLDFTRTKSPHLLQDQSLESTLQIKAVDKAGNESLITPMLAEGPGVSYKTYAIWTLCVLAILILIFLLLRLRTAKSRKDLRK